MLLLRLWLLRLRLLLLRLLLLRLLLLLSLGCKLLQLIVHVFDCSQHARHLCLDVILRWRLSEVARSARSRLNANVEAHKARRHTWWMLLWLLLLLLLLLSWPWHCSCCCCR